MKKDVKNWTVAVLGAGTMGLRIAQLFAMNQYEVKLYNRTVSKLPNAMRMIENNLNTMCKLGQLDPAQIPQILGRIHGSGDLRATVEDADLVIESVAEEVELKKTIFAQLDEYCAPDTILASDTSTMDIYDFVDISHPERLIIMHFFNPAYIMPLVELVRGPRTSDETVAAARALLTSAGKTVVVLNKVIPGFILNRITFAVLREATYIVEQGVTTPEEIDAAIVSTFGPRYAFEGPFGLSDFGGLDVIEQLCTLLFPVLSSSTEPPRSLHALTAAGKLGTKTGDGFYPYQDPAQAYAARDAKIVKMIQAIRQVNQEENG